MSADIPVADNPLFFLDYDGTLAPIVEDPAEAYPHPEVPELLSQLEKQYPVWIVTGRHLRDLTAFLDLPLRAIGLHGAQEGVIGRESKSLLPDEAAQALDRLRREVPEIDGLRVEDKEKAFAVHYRNVPDAEVAKKELASWAANVPEGIDAIWGKKVVELRAEGLDKGAAVTRVVADHPDRTPIYLGDDVTDEDAFRALGDAAITVKVGNGETAARYQLSGVEDVVAYLRKYVR